MLEQDEGDDRDRTDVSHQYLGSQDEECHEPARVVCLFIVQLSSLLNCLKHRENCESCHTEVTWKVMSVMSVETCITKSLDN